MKMNKGLGSMMLAAALAAGAYGCEAEHTPAAKSEGAEEVDGGNNGAGRQEEQPEGDNNYRGLPECEGDVLGAIRQQAEQIHALVDDCTLELQGDQVTGLGEFDPLKFTYDEVDNGIDIRRESVYRRSPEHFDPVDYYLATASQLDPYGNALMVWGLGDLSFADTAWQVSYNGGQVLVYDAQVGPDGAFHPGTVCLADQEVAYVFGFNTFGDLRSACQQSVDAELFHDLASGIHGRNEDVFQLFVQ